MTCALFVHTLLMSYRWDQYKAHQNWIKHRIDFADAIGVLEDEWALTIKGEWKNGEQRFSTLGMDLQLRIVVVTYTWREEDIRLISARKATKKERQVYEQKRGTRF